MNPGTNKPEIWGFVEEKREKFFELSDAIWETPEINYEEFLSSKQQMHALEAEGFRVQYAVGGLPTSLVAEAGEGGPVIALLGEFDALPALSQVAGVAVQQPVKAGGHGHGCGHNLLGTGALQAAVAVKDYLALHGVKARVRYYGCPAEEGGSGKAYMARAGLFDDVDAAITWHPHWYCGVGNPVSLATNEMIFEFQGRSAHAAASPHLGRSALDAVELMNVGVNYMREHMPSHARIHYAVTDTGGNAPNVVQGHAAVRYVVRGRNTAEVKDLVARVLKIADGAALMSETSVTHRVVTAEANLLGNETLEQAMHDQLIQLGLPEFDEADKRYAREIQATLSKDNIDLAYRAVQQPRSGDSPLCHFIVTPRSQDSTNIGSTDVGNVSWLTPTVEFKGATMAIGTALHSWQAVAQGKAPAAHKGMEHAAKVMAGTALSLILDSALLNRAKAEHRAHLEREPFQDPLPADARPELGLAEP